METQTQNIAIGTRLEFMADLSTALNHFKMPGDIAPICGAQLARPYMRCFAFVVSSQLLQLPASMHRLKAKTDCLQCMLALFKAIRNGNYSQATESPSGRAAAA